MNIAEQPPQPSRILVVDDERVIRDILDDFLTEEGFDVVTVSNGKEALDRLTREHFDVVLTDLMMPVMGGMELIEEIQRRKMRISAIMMTGYGTLETAVESMKRGAHDYIQKPFKMVDVLAVITRSLRELKIEEENVQLREIANLYKVSEAMNSSLSLDQILDVILNTIMDEIEADAVSLHHLAQNGHWNVLAKQCIKELDSGNRDLYGIPRYGSILSYFEVQHTKHQTPGRRGTARRAPTEEGKYDVIRKGTARRAPTDIKPEDLNDEAESPILPHPYILIEGKGAGPLFEELPEHTGLRSLLVVPLRVRSRTTGLVCCYAYRPGHHFLEGHSRVLSILASRAASAIENAQLYERLQRTLQETIQGLITALEAKDPYTLGHTRRVTDYAVMVAREMGLDKDETEKVRRAGLLHDIGKIGIRLESLNKSEGLSMDEYQAFKEHPSQSRIILEPIQFLRDIIPMVEAHHERWDGMGYPNGLKGEQIPLGARILTVADSFDAMTSDRPYRRALSRKRALQELRSNAGSQFDPEVVNVFIRELRRSG